ncbi:uncharacterized protein [Parasteatoda tepidariorum]|uniref:uncharacterized protein n=1 Tax=Parasteatoda tepidariorum TaxID=114398 RepID=UPI001C71E092|nr:uncharacterized protein LOC107438000 isoform X1 [Parasteatoda tepidariorum]
MNCEICAMKFRRLKDVIRHGASEMHIQFFCTPCALSLPSVFEVVEHIASKEHSITALATGVRFDTIDRSDFMSASFPPHNLCLLCGSRDGTPNNNHLKTDTHRYMAWLLRTMITSKKIYNSNWRDSYSTRSFICKMINAKRNTPLDDTRSFYICSSRFVCELCNLHFLKQEYLNEHLADQSHIRVEQFMMKISRIAKRIDVIGAGSDMNATKTFNRSLRPLYYCEVCCMWIDTHFNYIQHRKSIKHENARSLLKQSKKKKTGDSTMDRVVTDHYSKSVTGKHGQHSVGKELVTIKQHSRKNKNDVSDCCGEKASKKLKNSQSHSKDHYSSECAKRKEIMNEMEKGEDNFRGQARETIYKNSSSLDSVVCETESHFQKHSLKACVATSSSLQLGSETDENPPRSENNLRGQALETICKVPYALDIEVSDNLRVDNFHKHPLKACGATRSSSLEFGAETSETDENPPLRSEDNPRGQALETICKVPSTLDIEVSETEYHFQKHALKACGAKKSSSLQLGAETDENPLRSEDNLRGQALETICKVPSTLDSEVSKTEYHYQKHAINACGATRSSSLQLCAETSETDENPPLRSEDNLLDKILETICKVPSTLDIEVSVSFPNMKSEYHFQKHAINACDATRSSSLQLCAETDENPPLRPEDNLRDQALETICKVPSTLDIEVSETENHFQKHALEICPTTLSVETSEAAKNSPSRLEDGKIVSLRLSVEDRDDDLCEEHYCELCDFLCYSSMHYDQHLIGERHKRMRRLINKKVGFETKELETYGNSHPQQYNCELCDIFNHSSEEYEFHLNSAIHKKNKWLLYVLRQRPVSVAVMRY